MKRELSGLLLRCGEALAEPGLDGEEGGGRRETRGGQEECRIQSGGGGERQEGAEGFNMISLIMQLFSMNKYDLVE